MYQCQKTAYYAHELLENRRTKRFKNKADSCRLDNGKAIIRLYNTDIATIWREPEADGYTVQFNLNGWYTRTTRDRVDAICEEFLNCGLYTWSSKDHVWMLGNVIKLEENVPITRQMITQRPRHCGVQVDYIGLVHYYPDSDVLQIQQYSNALWIEYRQGQWHFISGKDNARAYKRIQKPKFDIMLNNLRALASDEHLLPKALALMGNYIFGVKS